MNKRAIAILGGIFILIVGTLGVVIYLRSRNSTTTDTPATPDVVVEQPTDVVPDNTDNPDNPSTPTGAAATKLTDEGVISPALFFQGDGIAYFNTSGDLFRTDMSISDNTVLLSNKSQLTVPQKNGISIILWPRVGSSYIAELGSGTSKQWSYYNPATGQYIDLPSQVKSLSWMPSGDKIMFVWVGSDGKATLNIGNPDTSGYQLLSDLYEPDNVISVSPDGQTVLFYRTQTSDLGKNTINSVTADGKIFNSVIREGYNKGILWSPDSKKFLFEKRDPSTGKFNLWFADISSGDVRNLGLATSETKAVWTKDSQSIVVAVPTSGTVGEGITTDTIYKVGLYDNSKTEFAPGVQLDARELFLSLDENTVFFKNAQDNALYYLPL